MDKYKELRDAIAAGPTKGIWVQDNEPYIVSDFQITTQDRIDESFGGICAMEVDFDGEFGTEQKANAAYICAASPETVAALLAERDELLKDKKRLDYVISLGAVSFDTDFSDGARLYKTYWIDGHDLVAQGVDVRDAIDKAIATESEHE